MTSVYSHACSVCFSLCVPLSLCFSVSCFLCVTLCVHNICFSTPMRRSIMKSRTKTLSSLSTSGRRTKMPKCLDPTRRNKCSSGSSRASSRTASTREIQTKCCLSLALLCFSLVCVCMSRFLFLSVWYDPFAIVHVLTACCRELWRHSILRSASTLISLHNPQLE